MAGCCPTEPPCEGTECEENPPIDEKTVNNGILFPHVEGETEDDRYYNYCPTIFDEDGTRHIYYCSNKIHGNVTDYIAYRSATKNSDGKWVYSAVQFVLEPTAGTWDERHTCDPSVIKGEFSYKSETYTYMMAYLGCVTSNNQDNETGIAVAKAPAGPWVKIDANPIVPYEMQHNGGFEWGAGQPSLVSVNKKGLVMLFYTLGNGVTTSEYVQRWDFSDLESPIKLEEKIVTTRGLKNLNGNADYINNADFGYDPFKGRIYMFKDDHPTPAGDPGVAASSTLYYLQENKDASEYYPGYTLFNIAGDSWVEVGRVDKNITGYDRNHNSGIVTDPYGWLLSDKLLDCVVTAANAMPTFWPALATYRLYQYTMSIEE